MQYDFKELSNLYSAAQTKRWHNRQRVTQTLAEHVFGMILIVTTLHPNPSSALLKSLSRHDLHESKFGDIPHETKRLIPQLKEIEQEFEILFWEEKGIDLYEGLDESDKLWISFADKYEAFLFLTNQFFLQPELADVRLRCLEQAMQVAEQLKTFGFFLDPEETIN